MIRRCVYRAPQVQNDRIAFLAPTGDYIPERSPISINVRRDIYNTIGTECGFWEPKLLVAANKVYTKLPSIVKNPDYEINPNDLKYLSEVGVVMSKYMDQALDEARPDEVEGRAKKLTSIGYPFLTVEREHIAPEDIAIKAKVDTPLYAWKHDWLNVKKGWFESFEGSIEILYRQLSFSGEISASNVVRLAFHEFMIGVAGMNFRTNCPDSPQHKGLYGSELLSGKDRLFSDTYVDHFVRGTLDTKMFNAYLVQRLHQLFAANRIRWIYVMNTITQFPGIVLTRALTEKYEHQASGMLSNKPETIARFDRYRENVVRRGRKLQIFRQDRSNSEVSITTNFKLYMPLFPRWMHNYLKLMSTIVVPCINGLRVQSDAFTSGVFYTTFGNMVIGLYTAAMTFVLSWCDALKSKDELGDILKIVIGVFENHEEVVLSNGVVVLPCLVTDDVLWPFDAPNDASPNERWLKDYGGRTQLNTTISESETGFGVHVSKDGIMMAPSSILSKVLFSEHPGFPPKDGNSINARLKLLPDEMRDIIDFVLKKHFDGVGISAYAKYVPLFWVALEDAGLDIRDVYNEFSPVEKMLMESVERKTGSPIFGKFVSETSWIDSARVSPLAIDRYLTAFKKERRKAA